MPVSTSTSTTETSVVDDCVSGSHDCDLNAVCTTSQASYSCSYNSGYIGNGNTCIDVCDHITCGEGFTCTHDEDRTPVCTDTSHILAIWGWPSSEAMLTDSDGETTSIKWGNEAEVDARSFCSLTLKNQFYILG